MTKYVELVVEDLRTRVRFPPTPPLLVALTSNPLRNIALRGFSTFSVILKVERIKLSYEPPIKLYASTSPSSF